MLLAITRIKKLNSRIIVFKAKRFTFERIKGLHFMFTKDELTPAQSLNESCNCKPNTIRMQLL